MAINIFSGTSNRGKTKSTNTAAASDRAKQAKAALSGSSETSSSGSTAVGTGGLLSKVGNVVGKVAGFAGKFLPGIGGTIARGISNLFNDPEWWQSVPGDAITLNESLALSEIGIVTDSDKEHKAFYHRPAIGEFVTKGARRSGTTPKTVEVFTPTEQQVTQYLMPQVRKVVNAITLQSAEDYKKALQSGVAIYASWRTLKKIDYMCKHGQTYLANMNDIAFPLFQTANAAWLQSTINRLEEYLRANVRLPHTMCEYLAWRYGRVYKSNNSAKAALILYNVLPLGADPTVWDAFLAERMNDVASAPTVQKANTDLFNAYYDHDYMVEVRDDTQFKYDCKEFMLRLNLQGSLVQNDKYGASTLVAIDSNLDNPTAFMASTVSTYGYDTAGNASNLFPVDSNVSVYLPSSNFAGKSGLKIGVRTEFGGAKITADVMYSPASSYGFANDAYTALKNSSLWLLGSFYMDTVYEATDDDSHTGAVLSALSALGLSKAIDLYNAGIWVAIWPADNVTAATMAGYLDLSALSIDAGAPTGTIVATEHVYAFANLVDMERKHSMSYKQAEKLVARDTANLVESLDVASVAPSK